MGHKLSPTDKELYQRVDEVLHYIWDPIGVSGVPMARDEYYSYLPHVFGLLKENKGKKEIVRYLASVEVDRMGLRDGGERNEAVADILLDWKATIDEKTT